VYKIIRNKGAMLLLAVCLIAVAGTVGVTYKDRIFSQGNSERQKQLSDSVVSNQLRSKQVSHSGDDVIDQRATNERSDSIYSGVQARGATSRNYSRAELKKIAQSVAQADNSRAVLSASQKALLENQQTLKQLQAEWDRHATQLREHKSDQRAAQAAANYELVDAEEISALQEKLLRTQGAGKPNYATGMKPEVVDRVQQTTGISSTEIEELMNK